MSFAHSKETRLPPIRTDSVELLPDLVEEDRQPLVDSNVSLSPTDIRQYIAECVEQCVTAKRDLLADALIDRVEAIVAERFYQEVHNLEQRWQHNPYMDLFLAAHAGRAYNFNDVSKEKNATMPAVADVDTSSNAYTDLVRQIAYDFRRFFFLEWQRELRAARPQLDHTQRAVLREIAHDRCDDIERRVQNQHCATLRSERALERRVATLERFINERHSEEKEELGSIAAPGGKEDMLDEDFDWNLRIIDQQIEREDELDLVWMCDNTATAVSAPKQSSRRQRSKNKQQSSLSTNIANALQDAETTSEQAETEL